MTTAPVREAPVRTVEPRPLDDVLRRINRLRADHGADPLYELPAACTAWEGGGCVLERAFADIGVSFVGYGRAYGPGGDFEHGLGDFIRAFDAGKHPELRSSRWSSSPAE